MKDRGRTIFGLIFVIALFVGAIFFASYVENNENIKSLISSFGPLGIFIVAFIGGLNLFVPVPATAFIPIFSSAGFSLPLIISILVIGTTIADLLSFYIGTVLRPKADKSKNKTLKFVRKYCENKPKMTQLIVFLWASLIPIPNELLLLPLGMLGVKLQRIVLAFTFGTAVHTTILAFALTSFV